MVYCTLQVLSVDAESVLIEVELAFSTESQKYYLQSMYSSSKFNVIGYRSARGYAEDAKLEDGSARSERRRIDEQILPKSA
jgi:hypothetical protein